MLRPRRRPGLQLWAGARADIDRIETIWRECIASSGGPFLFGELTMADAMFAPVTTRFRTYRVPIAAESSAYCERILALPAMREWIAAAHDEPGGVAELEAEF